MNIGAVAAATAAPLILRPNSGATTYDRIGVAPMEMSSPNRATVMRSTADGSSSPTPAIEGWSAAIPSVTYPTSHPFAMYPYRLIGPTTAILA